MILITSLHNFKDADSCLVQIQLRGWKQFFIASMSQVKLTQKYDYEHRHVLYANQNMRFNSVISFAFLILFLSMHLEAYNPVDRFTISCGATGKSFDSGRTWIGDRDSNLLSHEDNTVSANATTQSPLTNQVPFTTARLSRSQFNYSFPVTAGPKFLRLFFYPASYPSFPRTEASFTVQSNQFTLLNGFNTSLNADSEDRKTIFREYIVNVDEGERLNLSFTPSSQPNSYAFINGIEVFSMPNDLYYTLANDTGFKLVGSDILYSLRTNSALETVYRIKIGGQGISPQNDTGLFRNWAGEDQDYLATQNFKDNLSSDMDGKMNITVNPGYVAPKELYQTAHDMRRNPMNKSGEFSWEFPVDSGFYYMVRLHFCEVESNINNIGDRVFFIYIAGELAEDHADVMGWSQNQKGLAVHKDYAVLIPENDTKKKVNLSLQMHPYEDNLDSKPFLNGLEIFKIIGTNWQNNMVIQKGKNSNRTSNVMIAGVISAIILISLGIFFVFWLATSKFCPLSFLTKTRASELQFQRHSRKQTSDNTDRLEKSTQKSTLNQIRVKSTDKQGWNLDSSMMMMLQEFELCHRFSLNQINAATKYFNSYFIVGVGGFGNVYKGKIDGLSTPVAIKRLRPGSNQGVHEFLNEIQMLSQFRHRHLVPLIGYCDDNNEKILVYDFMARGNLRNHLYNTDNPPLSWKQRLQICIGAAHGLHYLHKCADKYTIIHGDVKTTNILLDEDWVAKVSDFGLSTIRHMDTSKEHVSTTALKGSFGYFDPEYCKLQHLTEKSDVYSFGVVLFEVLCARPPLIQTTDPYEESLANWVRYCYHSGTLEQIVDPKLKGRIAPECFRKFCEIGVSCLREVGKQRPSMIDVVAMLEFVLQLQQSAEKRENII